MGPKHGDMDLDLNLDLRVGDLDLRPEDLTTSLTETVLQGSFLHLDLGPPPGGLDKTLILTIATNHQTELKKSKCVVK